MGITNDHFTIKIFETIITLLIVMIAWIFFRAENIGHAVNYLSEILSPSLFTKPEFTEMKGALTTIILVIVVLFIEWSGREGQYAIAHWGVKWKRPIRWIMYFILIFLIGMFMHTEETPFIYFQF
jgi:D-alanyl-lipoteichoic acid acyltransferase DltB (MBOAT superfamily)